MTTPSTSIYVRPGWTSYTWTYAGSSLGASPISAVAFSFDSDGPLIDRGDFQYSVDGGKSWTSYAMQADGDGVYMPAAGTLWRFVDQVAGDDGTAERFVMHWKLADGSVVSSNAGVVPDNQPLGITYEHNYVFSTQQAGDAVAALNPIDTGAPNGGRWVIDDQSQPGLFGVTTNPDTGATELVIADPGAMPAVGDAISVTMHYYDRYQLDSNGDPIKVTYGVTDTLVFSVMQGTTQQLPAFGADLSLGAASGPGASPAIASLAGGGFVTAWQGSGNAIWAQVRDAGGAALGAPFAVSSTTDGAAETQPAVAALSGGRFVVAYTVQQDGASSVAYRIVEANGSVGQQLAAGTPGDASMPTATALADGSFVLGWESGGQVHLLHESSAGAAVGTEQVAGALGTAYSPGITALHNGDYVVAWGEIGDGNVYAALGSSPGAPIQVSADGAAASVSTAAPLPHVAALAGGGFVVAWDSYHNDPFGFAASDIFFQRYDNAGNALGAMEQANMAGGTGRFDASVSALPDGGFVIGWQAQGADGDGNGVFGRRFGADGAPVDVQEFQVNQMSVGDQASPALAVLSNGGVATAWVDTQHGVSTIEARVLAGSGAATDSGGGSGSGGSVTPAPGGSTGGGSSGGGTVDTGGGGSGSTGGSGSGSTGGGSGSTGSGSGSTGGGGSVSVPPPELLTGNGGANVFTSVGGSHAIDGGDGTDTVVYQASHAGVTVTAGPNGFTVSGNGIQDGLVNVERLQFSDVSVALDINGTAGEAYRLYQAAFDRAPDLAGLGYWIKMLDNGASLNLVAQSFVSSLEFANQYGANASDSQFVQALYQNVLHRIPEQAGYDFWVASLEQYGASRADVLAHFSESLENQAQVIGSMQDGILFTPWG